MPVAVACSCGAKLRVPDTAAGKRVKCPKCGGAVAVPAAEYEVLDDLPAKKAVARPKRVPLDVDEVADDRPKSKRRRDPDDEDDTPKRAGKKAKGNLPLLLGVGGGAVVLLAVVGVIVAVAMNGPGGGPAQVTNPTGPAAAVTPGGGPAGWKEFRGDGVTVWIPESATMTERENDNSFPLPMTGKRWASAAADEPPTPAVPVYELQRGTLDPPTAAAFRQAPAAAWDEALKGWNADVGKHGVKVTMSDATLGGWPAKQFVVFLPSSHVVVRSAVRGDVVCTATVHHRFNRDEFPGVVNYLDSVKIQDADTQTRTDPAADKPVEWKAFAGDGFTVELPGGLTMRENATLSNPTDGPAGRKAKGWSSDVPGEPTDVSFAIIKSELSAQAVAKFDEMREASWASIVKVYSKAKEGETVSAARAVKSAGGLEGREFMKQRADGRQAVRLYIAGGHLYTLMVVQLGREVKDDPRTEKFLASFRPE